MSDSTNDSVLDGAKAKIYGESGEPESDVSAVLDVQALLNELYPLCRSLTGVGYERSLETLSRYIPFACEEYPCGSQVFDWTVPPKWILRHARLKDSRGNVILDVADNALHVLNYSVPFHGVISRAELEEHLYSEPNFEDMVIYATSYYKDRWGFCLSHKQRQQLTDDYYEVDIDTEKTMDGAIKIGVCDLPGKSDRIVQISSYLCHPNMLNNELSGPIAMIYLYHLLKAMPERHYTYRFVINPETIGSICYLSRHNEELQQRLEYGVILTCVGSFYKDGGSKGPIAPVQLPVCTNYGDSDSVEATFERLLRDIKASYQHNFLEIPLSFKLSKQSMDDELRFALNFQRLQYLHAGSENSGAAAESEQQYDDVGKVSFAHGIVSSSKQLSDTERVALYREHLDADNFKYDVASALVEQAVPRAQMHNFAYSYPIDRFLAAMAHEQPQDFSLRRYSPTSGSDERQYGSALVKLPVVQATRVQYASYPEYHSAWDNQDLFSLDSIVDSAVRVFELLRSYRSRKSSFTITTCCEPQLGKRNLYTDINVHGISKNLKAGSVPINTLLVLLNLCDGSFSSRDLATLSGLSEEEVVSVLDMLCDHCLIVC